MTSRLRKLALTAHIAVSVGWIGAVAGFLALSIAGLTSKDAEVVRSVYFAMEMIASFVIVPMSLAAVATGLVQALGTEWGLLRYYWVLGKLFLTIFATIVLLLKMPLIGYAARQAAATTLPAANLLAVGLQLLIHAAGGIIVLLAITTLSVFKPWGRTGYGRRRVQIENASMTSFPPPMLPDSDREAIAGDSPAGRKWFLVAVGAIIVGFVAIHLIVFHLVRSGLGH